MKKLLLLSALLIFACSSDEGNNDYDNNSDETFLERYDGVVWELTDEEGTHYIRFNDDPLNWLTSYEFDDIELEYECYNLSNIQEPIFSIVINSGNNFNYSVQYPGEDEEFVYVTVSDNGNILEIDNPSHNSLGTFSRSDLTEIPCP